MPNWDQIRCVHWFGSPRCEALPLVALQQGHRNWQAWAGIRNTQDHHRVSSACGSPGLRVVLTPKSFHGHCSVVSSERLSQCTLSTAPKSHANHED